MNNIMESFRAREDDYIANTNLPLPIRNHLYAVT